MSEYQRNWWIVAALAVAVAVTAAGVAYNVGLSHGLAQVGAASGPPPAYRSGWHWWGPGFLFPLLFFFFWVMVIKGLWWGRWGYWSYYGPPRHPRDRFDEWHRQAHERMGGTADRQS